MLPSVKLEGAKYQVILTVPNFVENSMGDPAYVGPTHDASGGVRSLGDSGQFTSLMS